MTKARHTKNCIFGEIQNQCDYMEAQKAKDELQLIDVEKVFASKDEKLLKRIPGFFIRYLKKIVHQDDLNRFLIDNEGITGIEFVKNGLKFMDVHTVIKGEENLPADPKVIYVANHPLGGIDGLMILSTIYDKVDKNVRITSNDLLMNVKPLRDVFLGVNKHGGNSRDYIREMHQAFEGPNGVIFFPAGLVSRRTKGKIEDVEWKRTFVKKAVAHKRDVIPIHFDGRVSNFFYNLANLRKFLGIRYNIEMLYLPNEMFKHEHMTFNMTIGQAIPWQTFTNEKPAEEWAQFVKGIVYELGKKD